MLAYIFWHRPAHGVERDVYERELLRFHRSLERRRPSGYGGSCAFRVPELPWRARREDGPAPEDSSAYEDWYLLDGWSAVGVLEEAALSRGHVSAHDAVARHSGLGTGTIYRLGEGRARLQEVHASVWVSREPGGAMPALADLLADGSDPDGISVWRRCMALGPAPELCVLCAGGAGPRPRTGLAQERLPPGWRATLFAREPLL